MKIIRQIVWGAASGFAVIASMAETMPAVTDFLLHESGYRQERSGHVTSRGHLPPSVGKASNPGGNGPGPDTADGPPASAPVWFPAFADFGADERFGLERAHPAYDPAGLGGRPAAVAGGEGSIPEPGTIALLAAGLAGLGLVGKRRRGVPSAET